MKNKGIKMHCKTCKHKWTYKGTKKPGQYITCSACKKPIKLTKGDIHGEKE